MVQLQQVFAFGLALCVPLIQAAPQATTTAATPLCTPEHQGIIQPTNGQTITQVEDSNYDTTTVEIIYCSGQYDKTRSIDASVFLSSPDSLNNGQLLAKDVQPTDQDSYAGYYSYRFNVTIAPIDGTYETGLRTLSIYETATGYYNPMNYEITSINVTLATSSSSR